MITADTIILKPEEFAPVFNKAWYVVINGELYEKIDDYERDDESLCTVFSATNCDDVIEIDYEKVESVCDVKYNRKTGEYEFLGEAAKDLPVFQILGLITMTTCCGVVKPTIGE